MFVVTKLPVLSISLSLDLLKKVRRSQLTTNKSIDWVLVKCLHPNLSNVTKELSKANNNVNSAAYKELLHVIRYVINAKAFGLKIEPMENFDKP